MAKGVSMDKTIILPADDSLAKTMFDEIVQKNPFVLLVVIGLNKEAKDLAALGDLMAGGAYHPSWRRVVWIQDPDQLSKLMEGISIKPGIPDPRTSEMYGFFINFYDQVCSVIQKPEQIQKGPIVQGYILAERPS